MIYIVLSSRPARRLKTILWRITPCHLEFVCSLIVDIFFFWLSYCLLIELYSMIHNVELNRIGINFILQSRNFFKEGRRGSEWRSVKMLLWAVEVSWYMLWKVYAVDLFIHVDCVLLGDMGNNNATANAIKVKFCLLSFFLFTYPFLPLFSIYNILILFLQWHCSFAL